MITPDLKIADLKLHKVYINTKTMKKIGLLLLSLTLLSPGYINAERDKTKDKEKARKEVTKEAKKALNQSVSKSAKKEAKKLIKEGWTTAPGALPIEKQLDKAYTLQYEYDDDGYPKYIMAEGMSVGNNYDAAKMQALELAKQNLASQIQTEVTALVESSVANNQGDDSSTVSLAKTVMASKNLISQSIGRVQPIVEVYRNTGKNNKEVLIRIAYNSEKAIEAAKNAIRKELEKQGDSLHENLDDILGW